MVCFPSSPQPPCFIIINIKLINNQNYPLKKEKKIFWKKKHFIVNNSIKKLINNNIKVYNYYFLNLRDIFTIWEKKM